MLSLVLAFRNVFRHRARSLVALGAIAFSTIVLMLAGGFVAWIFWAMRGAAVETGLGHVQIMRAHFLDEGVANPYAFLLPDDSPVLAALQKDPHVAAVARRLQFSGLVSLGDATLAFIGSGVEPGPESVVSKSLPIVEGSNLDASDDGVVLGTGLAAALGAKPGARVVLLVNTAGGGVSAVEATVKGLFSTQVKAYDDFALKIPLQTARRLMKAKGAHLWVVSLDDIDGVDAAARGWSAAHAEAGLEFHAWTDLADFFNKTVRLLSSQMDVFRLLIGVILVLGISNILVMNVLERTGEIGTLMALGARRAGIVRLFVGEGLLLGLVGGVVGVLVGYGLAEAISAVGIPMPPPPGRSVGYDARIRLDWTLVAWAFAISVGTTLVASIYPSVRASRLNAVDALRQNR